jgi:hypothetical protein
MKMSIRERTIFAAVLVCVLTGVYVGKYLNLGPRLYNGCLGGPGLARGTRRFDSLPPHYLCEYRTKSGRIVERSW